jgi:hypothetical protein
MRMIRIVLVFMGLLALVNKPVLGQSTAGDEQTLRGVTRVNVVIEELPSDAINDGLTKDQLQTDVELRLRGARLQIAGTAYALLYVNTHLMKSRAGLYIYNVVVQVEQPVTVLANSTITVAPTWHQEGMGSEMASTMAQTVRDKVAFLVDKFLNDYLRVNPK